MSIDDILGLELATGRTVPTSVAGEPYESWHVISDDGRVELGVWEVTPGSFRGSCEGIYEQMHFVAGCGTITEADGVVTEISVREGDTVEAGAPLFTVSPPPKGV
jgi:uncharacterized cupin superfamily protein